MSPRTIVITGASDGIGAAAARALTTSGEPVVIVGRSPSKTSANAAALAGVYHFTDSTRPGDIRELTRTLGKRDPRIVVVVNIAGGIFRDPERT